jgi:flagellar motor protein MotB
MTLKTALLRGAAFGALFALAAGAAAHAETTTKKHHHRVEHIAAAQSSTSEEVRALRAEVEELKARLDAQGQQQQATAAQVAQTQTQVQEVAANADSAQEKIETIPEQVNVAIGQLPKPKTDKLYYKGVGITLGGFLEAADINRSHNMVSDIATNFSQIPFKGPAAFTAGSSSGNPAEIGHTSENRLTARQSRLSALVQGDAAPDIHLAMYGEFDFQSAAQTANSNETNSYNPRIRHLYGTVDWDNFGGHDFGLHLLAGQNWSLATMNTKGITPRNELTPPQIDAQYVPGFTFTRQPQARVTADFLDHTLWAAVSVENPATTTTGAVPTNTIVTATGQSGFNSANQVSLNKYPDVIAKLAYEFKPIYGRTLHIEGFGILRDFDDRHPTPLLTSITRENQDVSTASFGAGVVFQAIPSVLDVQASFISGKGVGRYTASQLPDATFGPNGKLDPIAQTSWLAGGTWHVLPIFDIYGFVGRDQQDRTSAISVGGVNYGLGNGLLDARACAFETGAPAGTACNVQTKDIQQETVGFWHKVYQGNFGRLQWGMQYSRTERDSFSGVAGSTAQGREDMVFTSFRYYPF